MRRLIGFISVLAILALPAAAAAAARNYVGPDFGLGMKAYKNQVKEVIVGELNLQCDEGTTTTAAAGPAPMFKLDPAKQVNKRRKFHVVADKTLNFALIDPNTDEVVGVDHDHFTVDASGKFNKRYSKVSGTLRFTGSYRGPRPDATYPGQKIQYHNCDSGTVSWSAHLFQY